MIAKSLIAIPFSLVLALPASVEGRDDRDSITVTFYIYREELKNATTLEQLEIDLGSKYTYPPLFEYYPLDTVRAELEAAYADSSNIAAFQSVRGSLDSLDFISDIIEVDDVKYAVIKYNAKIRMDMSEMRGEGGADFAISAMLHLLVDSVGEDNVQFDKEAYVINVTYPTETYCILDPKYVGWKFMVKNQPELQPYLDKLLPAKVLKSF